MKKLFLFFFCVITLASCDSSGSSNYDPWGMVSYPTYYPEVYYDQFGYENPNGIYQQNEFGGLTFRGSQNSDGYIPDGKVTLCTIGGICNTFKSYKKDTNKYAYYGGLYYKLTGQKSVTINNLKYKIS